MSTVGDDCGRRAQRTRVELLHVPGLELREALGQTDRRVHERAPGDATSREQHQRDADRVDRREHDVGTVELPDGREDGREIAAVASCRFERAPERGAGRSRQPR